MFFIQHRLSYKLEPKASSRAADRHTHANTQTLAHVTETEMYWELSQGSGRATKGSHVSMSTHKGAEQRVEHGPDMSAGSDAKRSPQTPPSV